MDVRDAYENGECPDCGDPIPKDAVDGSDCSNCGHVFYEEEPGGALAYEIEKLHGKIATLRHALKQCGCVHRFGMPQSCDNYPDKPPCPRCKALTATNDGPWAIQENDA